MVMTGDARLEMKKNPVFRPPLRDLRCLRPEMLKPLLASLFLLLSTGAVAQEAGYLDLTGVIPRTNLRYPPAPPPKPLPRACKNGLCTGFGIAGASMGVSIGCGAGDSRDPRALKTTLTWLNQIDYQIGDNIEFEIRLDNVGSETMAIPWTPHLADLQPADDSKPFNYLELDLTLDIKTDSATVSLPPVELHGSEEAAGTIVELAPGAWVRVRASVKLIVNELARRRAQQQDTPWEANARFGYRHDSFHPHPGGYGTEINNDYPRSLQGHPLPMHIYLTGN